MGVPIDIWVSTLKKYPAKYRFEGLWGERGSNGFYTDVREAAVADEEFMSHYMEEEAQSRLESLKEELAGPPPAPGEEDDPDTESYAQFLRSRRWRGWMEPENINLATARKIIEKLEPKDGEIVECRGWGKCDADGFRYAWACDSNDPQWAWDVIRQDDPSYFLEEHPPIEMLDHASGTGVPLDEIIFVCPSCHQNPVRESDVTGAHYYCGLCGAESLPDVGQTLEDWAEAVGVKLWPFRREE